MVFLLAFVSEKELGEKLIFLIIFQFMPNVARNKTNYQQFSL